MLISNEYARQMAAEYIKTEAGTPLANWFVKECVKYFPSRLEDYMKNIDENIALIKKYGATDKSTSETYVSSKRFDDLIFDIGSEVDSGFEDDYHTLFEEIREFYTKKLRYEGSYNIKQQVFSMLLSYGEQIIDELESRL